MKLAVSLLAVAILSTAAMGTACADLVGSSTWFRDNTDIALDRAAQRQQQGSRSPDAKKHIVKGYVRVDGKFVFPRGNPFSHGQLPALHIKCMNPKADGRIYAPVVHSNHSFTVILKRGQIYEFDWMSYFGFLQKIRTVRIPEHGARTFDLTISYVRVPTHARRTAHAVNASGNSAHTPQNAPAYHPPQAGPAFHPPQAGPAFHPPQAGPAFHAE